MPKLAKPLRFGTLGTARITPRALLYPCMDEPAAFVRCIAARDRTRAEAFAEHHNIGQVWDSYQQVVDDPKVDALYNPLPINLHHSWTLAALNAGKHVLCEKSLASNAAEAQAMQDLAAANDRVLMDAFHYRYHPAFIRAREDVAAGQLGELREGHAAFHVPVTNPDDIRMNYATGGGVTMDIGCYPVSWVRHITAAEPVSVSASAEEGPPAVDLWLRSEMEFPGGVRVTTSGDMRPSTKFQAVLEVKGNNGSLTFNNPIVPQSGHSIEITTNGRTRTEVLDRRPTYSYQLDAFLAAINTGAPLFTGGQDGVAQMHVIDQLYTAAGLPLRGGSL